MACWIASVLVLGVGSLSPPPSLRMNPIAFGFKPVSMSHQLPLVRQTPVPAVHFAPVMSEFDQALAGAILRYLGIICHRSFMFSSR
jgi:hypothetical protein